MKSLLSRRVGTSAAVFAFGAAMAAGGATAASAASTPSTISAPSTATSARQDAGTAVAGTGACTTGMVCLWGKPNYDPPLVTRRPPVTRTYWDVGTIGAVSGYNATEQGQILWKSVEGCRSRTGPNVYIRPYTKFSDIRPRLGWRGGFCLTHS
ncbi:hypothetical protein [Actinomadura chibensis]|uniref:Peptidase inhibitor family I36 protein n=1 Tax=Actinomadura chibensis TaxID=392828 RepID=A0A5D0NU82_9ACTN|nr:hypothetical protein [Actinomadura chibensis]TYB47935.1 hypothetical protein FXF69_01440 [Actinomadura chibensis]